jgi:regulatory protein YycI of two-component signal transduction system YycFG
MMVSFMRYCKKIKVIFCVVALVLFSSSVVAEAGSLRLRSANLTVYEGDYLLNADAEINIAAEMEKAILKGFTFNFLIEFQLVSPKKYWFDDELVTTTQQVSLSYHALTRQYIVIRNDQQRAYANLDEALEDLSIIQDMKVFQEADVERGERYKAVLLMRLDQKKLPKALQIEGMTSSEWKLSSQRFEWTPNLFK